MPDDKREVKMQLYIRKGNLVRGYPLSRSHRKTGEPCHPGTVTNSIHVAIHPKYMYFPLVCHHTDQYGLADSAKDTARQHHKGASSF